MKRFISKVLLIAVLFCSIFWNINIANAVNTKSIDLERSSSHAVAASDSASLSITGDLTIEFWFRPESLPTGGAGIGFIDKMGSSGRSYKVRMNNISGASNKMLFAISTDGSNYYEVGWTNQSLYVDTWYHVAIIYHASTHLVDFYLDGSAINTGLDITGTSIYDGGNDFIIGKDVSNGVYFDGLIDDVRVWSSARTSSEVSTNRSTELVGNESGLSAYWKLNDALTDSTANSNTLSGTYVGYSADIPFGSVVVVAKPQNKKPRVIWVE